MRPWWIDLPVFISGIAIFAVSILCSIKYSKRYSDSPSHKSSNISFGIVVFGFVSSASWILAWNEKRVIAGFAEWFAAIVLCIIILVCSKLPDRIFINESFFTIL